LGATRVHPPALRDDPSLRPDGLRQVDDPLLGAQRDQIRPTSSSARPRTRSSTRFPASTRCRCTARSASRLPRRCAPSCARTPTSSSWVRSRHRDGGDRRRGGAHGHLLISTLHTNDAPSTIARLTDMEIEPFMISSSILCVCAQRLMRRVCKQCRISTSRRQGKGDPREGIGWSGPIFKHNTRAARSATGNGYRGRVGIHELMVTNEELIEGSTRSWRRPSSRRSRCAGNEDAPPGQPAEGQGEPLHHGGGHFHRSSGPDMSLRPALFLARRSRWPAATARRSQRTSATRRRTW